MSVLSGPGVRLPANAASDITPADASPLVIQAVPGQVGDQLQVNNASGTLQAHCDINGNMRAQSFSGLTTALNFGVANISMTSDANITPTTAQTQNGTLNVTSTLSLTATRQVVLPLVAGAQYDCVNNTTGGQALLFIGASGTGVTVTNGCRAAIVCVDGANWTRITEDFSNTGHEVFAQFPAPTAAAGANAGTSPPAPVVTAGDTDMRGNITFGTGTTPAAGAMVGVTFANPWAIAPTVMVVPRNTATQALGLYVTGNSVNGFTLSCTTAPAASQGNTIYSFDYSVLG